ncbi:MAG: RNA polymerase sigma factor [Deltaproteobacteria bacterium]|nr:MAG: RNA polymerase sigma factor [Deltaproteobacteria bacterium]
MEFDQSTLNRIYRYCLSLAADQDKAYDLMQTALEKFLRNRAERKDTDSATPSNPTAYLFRIIRNAFIDSQRRAKIRQHDELDESVMGSVDPSVIHRSMQSLEEVMMDREEVKVVLSHISEEHRELLFLWAVEGYTIQEIADLTQTPKGTLLSRVHRLRQKVLRLLNEGNGGTQEAMG